MYLQEQIGVQIFCPNCGHKSVVLLLKSGAVGMRCKRCNCVLVSKKMKDKQGFILKVNKN